MNKISDPVNIDVVHLDRTSDEQLRYFANFAEAVYREFRDNPRVMVDLEAVDQGSSVLAIISRAGLQRRIVKRLSKLIEIHFLSGHVRIEN